MLRIFRTIRIIGLILREIIPFAAAVQAAIKRLRHKE